MLRTMPSVCSPTIRTTRRNRRLYLRRRLDANESITSAYQSSADQFPLQKTTREDNSPNRRRHRAQNRLYDRSKATSKLYIYSHFWEKVKTRIKRKNRRILCATDCMQGPSSDEPPPSTKNYIDTRLDGRMQKPPKYDGALKPPHSVP